MNKISLSMISLASLGFVSGAFAADVPAKVVAPAPATASQSSSAFTAAQLGELKAVIQEEMDGYLKAHPEQVMAALQAGMALQQKEATAKIEKAVAANKDKLFKDAAAPIAGNPKGTQSLVVFLEPACGYCKKFYKELGPLLSTDKDVKVIFKDLPIMGGSSIMAIKAMLAAKEQGKYDQMQKAIYSLERPASKKQLLKLAGSLGLDVKKLEADMKSKAIQAQIDQTIELSKTLGITGTPLLIINETKVVPGYVTSDELLKMLQGSK